MQNFDRLKSLVLRHLLALCMGLILALLVISPHIRAWQIIGSERFEGFYPAFMDDEITYQARIKEVVEGNFSIGNPYLKEHMDDPFIMPPIAESIMAFFVVITGTSVPFITTLADFVLGFIDFLLIYALFLVIFKEKRGYALIYAVLFYICSLASFGRPISPQLNIVFFLLGMIFIMKLYVTEGIKTIRLNLIAGFLTGVSFFIYPYYFTTLVVFYCMLQGTRALFERNIKILTQHVPWFLVTFLPLALLYVFFQYKAAQDLFYSETLLRYGLMHLHLPGSFTNIALAGLTLGVVALSFTLVTNKVRAFGFAAVASIIILNWQNIITGKSLQFSSHYLVSTMLLIFLTICVIHAQLLRIERKGMHRYHVPLLAASMAMLLCIIVYHQRDEYMHLGSMSYTEAQLVAGQERMKVFSWLRENTPKDSVIYTLGDDYDFLIPVYTENRVYYNFYAALYPGSDREMEERWLANNIFHAEMSTTTIRESQRDFWGNQYIEWHASSENRKKIIAFFTSTEYVKGEMLPEERIDEMYARWKANALRPAREVLSSYALDYILLSKKYPYYNHAKVELERMEGVEFVVDVGGVEIYQF